MKYKYNISRIHREYVESLLRQYRRMCVELEREKQRYNPTCTAAYGGIGVHSGGTGRPVEEAANKIITSPYIRRLEQETEAVATALDEVDEIDKMIINLVYWRREYTPEGAGLAIGLSKTAVYDRINKVLGRIAECLGLINQ